MDTSKLLKRSAALAALATVLAIGGAQAQIQGSGPVAVTADNFEYQAAQGLAVYRGNAEAVQGQSRLRCSEIRIRGAAGGPGAGIGGGGSADRYECSGPVYYVTPTEQARGDAAVFTVANDTIVLTGNVVVRQGLNVAQGHRLTINSRTRDSRLESASGAPRVRTVIYPDEQGAAGAPARRPAAAPAAGSGGAASTSAPAAAAPAVAGE